MKIVDLKDGIAICGDGASQETVDLVRGACGGIPLIVTDPPYGGILGDSWDNKHASDEAHAVWMCEWVKKWSEALLQGGAFYVWGGIGAPGNRAFFRFLLKAEEQTELEMASLITWKKRRAYGTAWNYLFTREEIAYFTKGGRKKPRKFNIPLLEEKRGYEGYDPKHPAKSEYLRRTNVWTDVTEIFRGKQHVAEKPEKLYEIVIETHTEKGEWIVDPFAGSGTAARAARKTGRRFVVIEEDEKIFEQILRRLG